MKIKDGQALNAQFDRTKIAKYVADADVQTAVDQRLNELYPAEKFGATLLMDASAEKHVYKIYTVKNKDDNTEAQVEFHYKKSPITPEGKFLVVKNGEKMPGRLSR